MTQHTASEFRPRGAGKRRSSLSADEPESSAERPFRIIKKPPPKLHPNTRIIESLDFGDIITINVSGRVYQTHISTLERFPDSLLGDPARREPFYSPETNDYFFDRSGCSFEPILELYQTGKGLIRPNSIPLKTFLAELFFFDLGAVVIEEFLSREGLLKKSVILPTSKVKRVIFELFEFPEKNLIARAIATFNTITILMSIAGFCAQTLPQFHSHIYVSGSEPEKIDEWGEPAKDNPFFLVESFCTAWFTLDLLTRFIVSPMKRRFFRLPINIVDLLTIFPYCISLIISIHLEDTSAKMLFLTTLRILRVVRIFRVFKLGRYSSGLQVYALTLHAARYEVGLMLFVISIGTLIFSSTIYYAEQSAVPETTKFTSIPGGFWYAIITWTTVGYGDTVPQSIVGKIIGGCCALCGVLGLSFMVPIVVAYFEHFFFRTSDMEKLGEIFRELENLKQEQETRNLQNCGIEQCANQVKRKMTITVYADGSHFDHLVAYDASTANDSSKSTQVVQRRSSTLNAR